MSSAPQAEVQLQRCRRQQRTVADIGQQAAGDSSTADLLRAACDAVVDAGETAAAGAFRLVDDGLVQLEQGIGWPAAADERVPVAADGPVGRALATGEPAIVRDPQSGSAATTTNLLAADVAAVAAAVIGPPDDPWGVLATYATDEQFPDADIAFLESVAAVLSSAVDADRAETQLAEQESLVDRIVATSPVGVVVLDADGSLTFANGRAGEILGRSREELAGLGVDDPCWDPVAPDGTPLSSEECPIERVLTGGEPISDVEIGVCRGDGRRVRVSMEGAPLWADGEVDGAVITFADVTERTQLRSEIEEVYGRISDAFFALDEEWTFTYLNDRAHELINPEGRQLEGRNVWETFPDALGRKFKAEYERAMEKQETVSFEEYYPEPLDAWFEVQAYPSPTGLSVYFRDVTERKERERQLEQYRALTEAASDVIVTIDEESRIKSVNPAVEDVFGYEPEGLVGNSLTRLMPEEFRDAHRDALERYLETGEATLDWDYVELPGQRADGERISLGISFSEVEHGGERYFTGIVRDVTERKERERELQRTTARLEVLFENSPDMIDVLDPEGRIVETNRRLREELGYEEADLVGTGIWEIDRQVDEEDVSALLSGISLGESRTFDGRYRRQDGSTLPVEVSIVRLDIEGSDQFLAMSRDVTEREAAQRKLEESEQRYRTLADYFPNGVVTLFDHDLEYTLAAGQGFDRIEVTAADLEGRHFREVWDEATADVLTPLFEGALDGEQRSAELAYAGREWIVHAVPITDDRGDVFAGMTMAQDITERKAYRRQLEESEQRYRTLVEHFPNGAVGLFDENLTYTAIGGQFLDQVGVTPEERVGNSVTDIYPEDLVSTVEPHFEAALAGESNEFEVEYHDRHLLAHTHPVRDADGETFAGMLVVQDVTEREERQRQVREHERQLQQYKAYTDAILDAVDDVFYVVTEDGSFKRWNRSMNDVTGFTDAEIESMHPLDFIVEADQEVVATGIAEAFETGSARVEATVLTKDGERVPMEFVASTLENPDGQRVLAGIGRDVTRRKAHERELQRRARQQAVVAALGQFALEADDLDEVMDEAARQVASVLDNEYCKVLDLDPDERELVVRQGVGWREGIVGSAAVDADDNAQAGYTLCSEEPVVVEDLDSETRFSGPDLLTSHDVTSGISTVIGSVDDPWGILGTHDTAAREFTEEDVNFVQSVANVLAEAIERDRYQRELERLVEDLQESNERLEQFAYAASHDLQEPLRMVSSYLTLIDRRYGGELDADGREFLEFAVDGADRMREMIDGLLQYSRVDTRGDPFEPVELEAVLADVRQDLAVKIADHDAEITSETLPRVEGDRGQLRQVFQNLLDNAIEYSGEAPPRVRVAAERTGGRWTVSVSDEGIGIDPEDSERVFEVFQRLHGHGDGGGSGTGIGLALCERIVERHGGDIWLESEPGAGTTVSFTLPPAGDRDD